MLTSDSQGIHKFIFDRLTQIRDEIIMNDPEYRKLGEISLELMKQLAESFPRRIIIYWTNTTAAE